MEKNSRIFVAGHRGLVGSAIFRRLVRGGFTKLVTVPHAELDLTRQAETEAFFRREKPEYVFMAAAKVGGILANDTYPADFLYQNAAMALNVISAAHASGVLKLIYLGSSCLYPKHCPQPMAEEHLLTGAMEPTNEAYAVAKTAGIKLANALYRQHGFRAVSAMPTNIYGPGDNFDLENSHVLPALMRKFFLAAAAERGDFDLIQSEQRRFGALPADIRDMLFSIARQAGHHPPWEAPESLPPAAVTLWGSGEPRREFLFTDDLADALVFLMDNYDSPELVNVGCGEDHSIAGMAEMIKTLCGYRGPLLWDREKPDGAPRKLLDSSRIASLGWRPKTPLSDGLSAMLLWYKKEISAA